MFCGAPAQPRRGAAPPTARRSASPSSSPTTCSTSPAKSAESGKTPGTDLREGVPTLPVLYALADDDDDAAVGAAAGDPRPPARSPTTRCTPRRWTCCAESPALKRARETVRGYAEQARAQLAGLPDVPARRALESLCDFIADRTA